MNSVEINIVDATNDINNFLNNIPQETTHLYTFNDNKKIYKKNELNPELLQLVFQCITEANKIMIEKINHDYLLSDFEVWNICIVNNIFIFR